MKKKSFVLAIGLMSTPAAAMADACFTLEGSVVVNRCTGCVDVSLRELRPREDRTSGLFTGTSRKVRLNAGERATLAGSGLWTISHIDSCR